MHVVAHLARVPHQGTSIKNPPTGTALLSTQQSSPVSEEA